MKYGPLKKIHLRVGEIPLEVECLRDGTLDVCLTTGRVWSLYGGKKKQLKTRLDDDGYVVFDLSRAPNGQKRGRHVEYVSFLKDKTLKRRTRWRRRRKVFVHRLVKIKALAFAKGGQKWREYVNDLPRGIDVNHIGRKDDNRAYMLNLETERANRARVKMDQKEWEMQRQAF